MVWGGMLGAGRPPIQSIFKNFEVFDYNLKQTHLQTQKLTANSVYDVSANSANPLSKIANCYVNK